MNTKDFLRPDVPLGQTTRLAPALVVNFVLGGDGISRLHIAQP